MSTFRFQDLDLDFSRHPMTDDVSVKIDANAIKRALRNLILLKRYEKPFHPEIASGVSDMLFEQASFVTVMELKKRIQNMIAIYEPRIASSTVIVGFNEDQGRFDVTINFTVRNAITKIETLRLSVERTR